MHKLLPNHHLMNTINYMSRQWSSTGMGKPRRTEATFLGFLPIAAEYGWGVTVDGVNFAAVHLFEQDWHWGDNSTDTDDYSAAHPWILMFYGSDNSSYYQRFDSREAGQVSFDAMTVVPDQDQLLFYNS